MRSPCQWRYLAPQSVADPQVPCHEYPARLARLVLRVSPCCVRRRVGAHVLHLDRPDPEGRVGEVLRDPHHPVALQQVGRFR
eukprot:3264956-Pyramimonas_sp.AAC.1